MKESDSKKYPLPKSSIKYWPESDRPREKLLKQGEHNLSNTELLAILLRSGVKGESAVEVARKIVSKFKSFRNMAHTDINQWERIKGLGKAKIAQIKAAIEIGRRFNEEESKNKNATIKSSEDIAEIFMARMRDLKKEIFKVLLLNSKNRIIDIVEVTEGTVNFATPIIREVFHIAMQNFASSIICVHNHPAGDSSPSKEDKQFTKKLFQAGKSLQIKVLDHIIIGDDEYFSFSDEGMI